MNDSSCGATTFTRIRKKDYVVVRYDSKSFTSHYSKIKIDLYPTNALNSKNEILNYYESFRMLSYI